MYTMHELVSDFGSQEFSLTARLVEALSPTSSLYGVLWPIIMEQATEKQQKRLRYVNKFLDDIFRRIVSKQIKEEYLCTMEYKKKRYRGKTVSLDLSAVGPYWAAWGGKRVYFGSHDQFRKFCALGDVDPDLGASQYDRIYPDIPGYRSDQDGPKETSWIFISRDRDVLFETSSNNPNLDKYAYAHYFGISGRADKVIRMWEYWINALDVSWDYRSFGYRAAI
ncbi:uncharacterized protein FOMMEDRAFT_171218 [Fomitiporia mediterranea MF3/22]|uniref:uncharacterized protein n=1 Tax=Fomitiporia mediterranea (strain MF3/22) TaxID=694068 RepID=UPI0004408FD4|nr:uncharacterized protein FOMMEDRAFT_171218 [Fomitiporia mediterranea MF3/22]EJC98318.1 hypothetical protein FOMMEDRAFT_171218 [Fomitiporia mediterranea MF3/22]